MDAQDRIVLEHLSREFTTGEARIYDHVSSTFKWLMATLFAANGGAIIVLLGDRLSFEDHPGALGCFALGIILSVLMGMVSAFQSFRVLKPLNDTRGKVIQALITEHLADVEQAVVHLNTKMRPTWRTWFPTYIGLASFACFVLGIGTVACSMI